MPEGDNARQRAIDLVAETMSEIVSFWGFKSSTGRIWTLLYLSPDPLPADVIAERTRMSAGAVSMALSELMRWEIVGRAPAPGERKRHYRAETDVWGMVRRIIRQRELRLVARAVTRFEEAIELLQKDLEERPDDAQSSFMLDRLQGLLKLARIGYRIVDGLAQDGHFSLAPIRGTLRTGR